MAKEGSIAKDTFWNKLREKNGWSFKYIAKKTGIPQSTLGNWFSGVKAPRNEHHIRQLCELFEIPFDKGYNEFYHAEKKWDSTKKTQHYNDTFWNKLKEQNNLSNEEISEMTGIPKVTISSNFSGRYMPNAKSLEKYCKLFEIPLEQGKEEFKKAHKAFIAAQNGETPPEKSEEVKKAEAAKVSPKPEEAIDYTFWPSIFANAKFSTKDLSTYLNVEEDKVKKYFTGEIIPNFNQQRLLCGIYGGVDMTVGNYAFNLLHNHFVSDKNTIHATEAVTADKPTEFEILKRFYKKVEFEEFMEVQTLLIKKDPTLLKKIYGKVSYDTYNDIEAIVGK